MSRLNMIDPQQAQGTQKELLDAVQQKLGMTPNLVKVFANSPSVLQGYLGLNQGLAGGTLDVKLTEKIALAVSETNECNYCASAHTAIGHMVGLSKDQILDARRGSSSDPRQNAAIRFANSITVNRGWVSDEDLDQVRNAGYNDEEITEIVGHVVLSIFRNYFNHIAETPIDFPRVDPIATSAR